MKEERTRALEVSAEEFKVVKFMRKLTPAQRNCFERMILALQELRKATDDFTHLLLHGEKQATGAPE